MGTDQPSLVTVDLNSVNGCLACSAPAEGELSIHGERHRLATAAMIFGALAFVVPLGLALIVNPSPMFALGVFLAFGPPTLSVLIAYFVFLKPALWIRAFASRKMGKLGSALALILVTPACLIQFGIGFYNDFIRQAGDNVLLFIAGCAYGLFIFIAVMLHANARYGVSVPSCNSCRRELSKNWRIVSYDNNLRQLVLSKPAPSGHTSNV